MRRALALSSVVLVALTMIGPAEGDTNAHRAAVSFWAMRHEFLDTGTDTYRETAGGRGAAAAWPYSQALAATIAMTVVPKLGRLYIREAERRIDGLKRYLGPNGAYAAGIGSGDVYYDDNEWIALELVHCAKGNDDRNTVTTATGALLAMRLYEATHNRGYATWARRMLAWVEGCMLGPDGSLWDHLSLDGERDLRHWSYNQGTAIGAYVLLYRLTDDADALRRAEALANESLAYFDGTPGGPEPPCFLAIFFRNLLELYAVDGNPAYREVAQAYADAAREGSRLAGTSVFRFASHPPMLLGQAAMVQIYAALTTVP